MITATELTAAEQQEEDRLKQSEAEAKEQATLTMNAGSQIDQMVKDAAALAMEKQSRQDLQTGARITTRPRSTHPDLQCHAQRRGLAQVRGGKR